MNKSEVIERLIDLKNKAVTAGKKDVDDMEYYTGKVVAFNVAIEFVKAITEVEG